MNDQKRITKYTPPDEELPRLSVEEMEKVLQGFAWDYMVWTAKGAKESGIWSRGRGLCSILALWLDANVQKYVAEQVFSHVTQTFSDNPDVSRCYPFGGHGQFFQEGLGRTMHRNPLRRAWVRHYAMGGHGPLPSTLSVRAWRLWFAVKWEVKKLFKRR